MKPRTVLIVDDDFAVHDCVSSILVKVGFETVSAGNMSAAKAALDLCRVDAILVDTELGGKDGWSALSELRKISRAPALMLSKTGVDDGMQSRARRRGARGVLPKPLVETQVAAAVTALF